MKCNPWDNYLCAVQFPAPLRSGLGGGGDTQRALMSLIEDVKKLVLICLSMEEIFKPLC